jgi:hypothetical protein
MTKINFTNPAMHENFFNTMQITQKSLIFRSCDENILACEKNIFKTGLGFLKKS